MSEKKRHRRGRRQKKKGGIITTLILIVALGVFCFSGYQLYKIWSGYHEGQSEYDNIRELALEGDEDNNDTEEPFKVNFDELLKINSDTVGWIRFYPEPSQINYPVVQGPDNDLYLNKTFSANDNTVGAIFVNVDNNADFNDRNTIVYGHRMNDNSMFHDLEKYADKDFWNSNPNFYIYTPDGREITYHIYAAGQVEDTSNVYLTDFATDEDYQNYINETKSISNYDTGVEVNTSNVVTTLSTCTKASDNHRFVVIGVKAEEKQVE